MATAKINVVAHRVDGVKTTSEVDSTSFFSALGGFAVAINDPIAAAGSTIADATPIVATGVTKVTGADGTKGVILPGNLGIGSVFLIFNRTAAILKIYPDSATGKINDGTAAAALSVAASTSLIIVQGTASGISNSLFYTIPLVPS